MKWFERCVCASLCEDVVCLLLERSVSVVGEDSGCLQLVLVE